MHIREGDCINMTEFNDMENTEEHEDDKPGTIHSKLSRLSIERIRQFSRHWEETYAE